MSDEKVTVEMLRKVEAERDGLLEIAQAQGARINELDPQYVAHWEGEPSDADQAALDEVVKAAYRKMTEPCYACNHVHKGRECGQPIHPPSTKCMCIAKPQQEQKP